MVKGPFSLQVHENGITGLKAVGDRFDTDFIGRGRVLGDVVLHYRFPEEKWKQARTDNLGDWRKLADFNPENKNIWEATYDIRAQDVPALTLRVRFFFRNQALLWEIEVQNLTPRPIEIGDIAIPLRLSGAFGEDGVEIMEKRVIKHHFISGYGSFIYWTRANGEGPFLVLTPRSGTKLEYFEFTDQVRDVSTEFYVYIHSGMKGALETRGTWRQPHTSLMLAPAGQEDDTKSYGFSFHWAEDFDGVRDILYEEGLFDVRVIPGMTVPEDLEARLAVRSKNPFDLVAEFPDQTKIEPLAGKTKDTQVFRLRFLRRGENYLLVRDRQGRTTMLEFFVTEPLETLVKKRAAFIASHQQHRRPDRWYDGLFSQWDMRSKVLRGPDDTDGFDGWWGYVLACDDTALCKAPFIAAKNLSYPNPDEIASVEYYLEHFVWGKLQRTDKETPYPYGIYGVPNWFENRNSVWGFDSNGRGLEHLRRMYDYPHMVMLYFHMYQIAEQYPQLVHYLDASGYLERAFRTAVAYFEYPYRIMPWYEIYKWGCYNELLIVDLIKALEEEGRPADAFRLRSEWEKKVKYFIYDDPYPFRSEYSFDTTAFESSYALAKHALENPMAPDRDLWFDKNKKRWYSHPSVNRAEAEKFLARQLKANLACRGVVEPAYYHLGSDIRGESGRYALSYMSQMGGWAILDQALTYAADPFDLIRLGYASTLSSWALMNTGEADTNYGFWYPGKENDGASGWAFEPRKYGPIWIRKEMGRGVWFYDGEIDLGYGGALRAAATIVAEDPLFGWFAYGGILQKKGDVFSVIPRDGLRQRFNWISRSGHKIRLIVEFDGFAREKPVVFDSRRQELRFVIENGVGAAHSTRLRLQGFKPGEYDVRLDGKLAARIMINNRDEAIVRLKIGRFGHEVRIQRRG